MCLIWSFTTPRFSASSLDIVSFWSLPNADVRKSDMQQEGIEWRKPTWHVQCRRSVAKWATSEKPVKNNNFTKISSTTRTTYMFCSSGMHHHKSRGLVLKNMLFVKLSCFRMHCHQNLHCVYRWKRFNSLMIRLLSLKREHAQDMHRVLTPAVLKGSTLGEKGFFKVVLVWHQ